MATFDPDGVGIANGNIFGFPVQESEADIVIIPVPWDATASYGKGTSRGPAQVLEASTQLDFYHPQLKEAYATKVFMLPIPEEALQMNDNFELQTAAYIRFLEEGGRLEERPDFAQLLTDVNEAQKAIQAQLKTKALELIKQGKIPAVLGGEHSVPLGLLEALNEKNEQFGILHLDAHADLRNAYEGFEQSHASIFYNALKFKNIASLVQVGIRDVAAAEVKLIKESNGRIKTFFDWDLKEDQYKGKTWAQQVNEIINCLPQKVYVSYDIDALHPSLCPNTGTPVAGGFQLEELSFLLFELVKSGREIIGFDLCEVANGNNDWNANVGARALWSLVVATEKARRG
jgi:agmatinase